MFAALGGQVTVIDQRPRPLEFLDQEIGDELIHQLRKSDVMFRCGDAVERIDIVETPQRQGLIQLASGKHLVADVTFYPTLAECYKVAAYNAANKLALIRQATGAVVPAMADQATGAVVPAMVE
jgi:hypothetical protein